MWGIFQKVRTQRGEESVFDEVIWPVNGEFDGIFLPWSVLMILWNTFLPQATLPHNYINMWRNSSTASLLHLPWRSEVITTVLFWVGSAVLNDNEASSEMCSVACQKTHTMVVPTLIITHKELNHSDCCQQPSWWGWTGSVFNNTGWKCWVSYS